MKDNFKMDLGKAELIQIVAKPIVEKAVKTNLNKLKDLLENNRTELPDGSIITLSI